MLNIFKDGKRITPTDDSSGYVPTYEVEKLKDPSIYVLAAEDREESGLTRKER